MINRHDVHASFSKTYAYKKVTKPLLERKRRARINRCLEELKELMAKASVVEEQNVSKLEKADILELTVRHLQRLRRNTTPEEEAFRFQAGFSQCAVEAYNFLLNLPGVDSHLSQQLVNHLRTVVGPLSIQVPKFRLVFSQPESPAPEPDYPSRCCGDPGSSPPGLLMVATQDKLGVERKSFLNSRTEDEFVDRMWRPWKSMQ